MVGALSSSWRASTIRDSSGRCLGPFTSHDARPARSGHRRFRHLHMLLALMGRHSHCHNLVKGAGHLARLSAHGPDSRPASQIDAAVSRHLGTMHGGGQCSQGPALRVGSHPALLATGTLWPRQEQMRRSDPASLRRDDRRRDAVVASRTGPRPLHSAQQTVCRPYSCRRRVTRTNAITIHDER